MKDAIEVSVCGEVTITGPDRSTVVIHGRQPSIVLAALALERGRLSHETMADIIWGDRVGDHWSGALRGLYSKIRRALRDAGHDPAVLHSADGSVGFTVPVHTEIDRARSLLDGLRDEPDDDRIGELTGLHGALRQPFLPAHDGEWADDWRRHLDAVRHDVDHRLLDTLIATGRIDPALDHARRLVTADPVDETAHRRLIELLLSQRRHADAREAFTAYERMLHEEYGTDADPNLHRLVHGRHLGSVGLPALTNRTHHPHAHEPFIARRTEIERVRDVWKEVVTTTTPRVVVLNGRSGIGKSRLADHLATMLPEAAILWGRGHQFAGHPFGPVADAFAELLDRDPVFAHDVRQEFPTITHLLPDTDDPTRPPVDGDAGRRMALGVARDLLGTIVARPTVLVLDDLQWSSPDGLAVLTAVVPEMAGPLLLIVTRRVRTDDTTTALAVIQRTIPVTQIDLAPFDPDELAELWSASRPSPPSTGDLHLFVRRTAGLPFYASELLRAHSADDDPDDIPASVGEWVLGHRRGLDPTARSILDLIAVFRDPIGHQRITELTGHEDDETARALDRLTSAGLLGSPEPGSFEIPHDLTLETIYEHIGASSRALLHRRIGDHLDERGERPEIIAHHWTLAGPSRRENATGAHLRAGRNATRRGAWEAARHHLRVVADAGEHPAVRTEALIGLGTASLHRGRHDEARTVLSEAIELARDHHLVHELAEATLSLVGRAGRGAALVDDRHHAAWLRDALRLLTQETASPRPGATPPPTDDVTTALLASRLERELALAIMFEDHHESAELLDRSFERIEHLPDPPAMDRGAATLALRAVRNRGPDLHHRVDDIDRVLALPRPELGPEVTIAAHVYRHEDLLRLGRRTEAALDLDTAKRHADRYDHAYWRWAISTWEALSAVLDGDLETGENLATAAAEQRPGVVEAAACLQVNLTGIRLLQRRGEDIVETLETATILFPHVPTYRAVLALVRSEIGDRDGALRLLEELEPDGFSVLPDDTNRFLGLGVLAHVAADLDHERAATALYHLLRPFAGLHVLINCYGGGGAAWGPTSWALARLAPLAGHGSETRTRWADAIREVAATPVLRDRVLADATSAV